MSLQFKNPRGLWAVASQASAILAAALGAVLVTPHTSAQQAPAAPSRFVQPDPIDFNDHDGWTQIFGGRT